ncbi:MAG: hypothetical protein JRJ68_14320 [Deltaproteobacteria bacterium]|nr:hypothetical protein [Deltaproteobacteria bacterium]
MIKKRKNYRLSSSSKERKIQSQQNRVVRHKIENEVLAHLYSSNKPVTINELRKLAKKKKNDEINSAIENLLIKKYIRKNSRKEFLLLKTAPIYSGLLELNPKGFGFLIEPIPYREAPLLTKNSYISATHMNSALHGDKILIRLVRNRNNSRAEGQVIKILSRRNRTIAGFYTSDKRGNIVRPEDPRYPFLIKVASPPFKPHQGDAVLVRIKRDSQSATTISGEIIELLGNPDRIDVQMRLVIEKFSLPHSFSEGAIKEADSLSSTFPRTNNELIFGI